MSRYCHIQGCDDPAIYNVGGLWYCRAHKPIRFSDETVRLHEVE
jgi:hypothetical protein